MQGRLLIIAGSDPSGGAGIQADIKTATALGGYAATAITAITVQNTKGVSSVYPVPAQVIRDQIEAVLSDIGADAIKIGMIGTADVAETIADALSALDRNLPVVVDPVLVATSGDALASDGVVNVLRQRVIPRAAVVTPNTEEAAALTGVPVDNEAGMIAAGEALLAMGATAALVKGGHMSGDVVADFLVRKEGVKDFRNPRLETTSTHGTGCTLASAVATGLAQGMALEDSVARAVAYVHEAIKQAPGFGAGCGPLNHAVRVE